MILDGKKVAGEIESSIIQSRNNKRPGLAIIQIGNDPASNLYTSMKAKACERVNFYFKKYSFTNDISQDVIISLINKLNNDKKIDGILVQLPLPSHLDEEQICETIIPEKDVDGFNSLNTNRLMSRNRPDPYFIPATPAGVIRLLHYYNIKITGKRAVIIGHSNIVGMPMAHALLREWATVTICHIRTENLKEICRQADILISATGKAGLVTKDFIKSGAVVIDVGMNRITDSTGRNRVVGDVEPTVVQVADYITPVPGGVGPMTIAMLLSNTLKASKLKTNKSNC